MKQSLINDQKQVQVTLDHGRASGRCEAGWLHGSRRMLACFGRASGPLRRTRWTPGEARKASWTSLRGLGSRVSGGEEDAGLAAHAWARRVLPSLNSAGVPSSQGSDVLNWTIFKIVSELLFHIACLLHLQWMIPVSCWRVSCVLSRWTTARNRLSLAWSWLLSKIPSRAMGNDDCRGHGKQPSDLLATPFQFQLLDKGLVFSPDFCCRYRFCDFLFLRPFGEPHFSSHRPRCWGLNQSE